MTSQYGVVCKMTGLLKDVAANITHQSDSNLSVFACIASSERMVDSDWPQGLVVVAVDGQINRLSKNGA